MQTLKLLLFMAALVGIVSCSKKDKINGAATQSQPIGHATAQENVSPDNHLNPYDFVGKEHNRLLAMVRAYLESGGDNTVRGRNLFLMKHTSTHTNVEQLDKAVYHVIADTASRYLGNLSRLPITSDAKNAIVRIYKQVKTVKDNGEFSTFKAQLVKMEDGFLSSTNFSEKEKQLLLSAASVARHSTYYWLNDEELNVSADGRTASRSFFWKLIRAVGAASTDISSLVETIVTDNDLPTAITEAAAASSWAYDAFDYMIDF
ncbi:hypothetical protein [Niabella hibiscisoli]|uniref:hypothetical protein n=1 Tax=Niabella hibiscisoli TaxID=1825928 RepID=UPI001F0D6D0E|nr:hypothetical protein [Niabella hibiscisoli]MCH5717784.1 hypothetical protein [Niabella hibiscisoli]